MASDDERREVARRLREYVDLPDDWWQETCAEFYVEKCVFGNVDRHSEAELFKRLADLIEPSCDRDELLEEAKELEKCAWYFGLDFDEDEPLRDRLKEASEDFAVCASCIREACGEVVR